ncbi:MAG: hypothetical protein IKE03_05920, partial [Blautia sp.]|nr:hypothetical protein [Blautia sp.]
MKKNSRISFGPGAASLTLIVFILGVSSFALLSLTSSRSDMELARRSVDVAEEVYMLNARAEEDLAALDNLAASCAESSASDEAYLRAIGSVLPEGYDLEGRRISWTVQSQERMLDLAAEVSELGTF